MTVRGVDLQTWKDFQKAIIDAYGNLYGYVGQELTRALKLWLEKGGLEEPKGKSQSSKTTKELIRDAMIGLGGEATIQQVVGYVRDKHGTFNANSISTSMSDLSVNGPPSSLYPVSQRILERVSRGRYRLLRKEGAVQ